MEKINCYKCNNPNNPITAKFCNECGAGMICECGQIIIGGNFCSNCAKPIGDNNSESKISGRNKFVFREDADGRHMEADFSDHAAKDFSETLRDVLVAKHLTAGSLPENTDVTAENEQIEDAEIVGDQDTKTPSKNNNDTSNPKVENYPTLQSVVLKNLPSSEIEWVIVYSFYASDFGSKQYTRSDILKMYEVTNRKTKNTARDLGSRIRRAVQSNCINPLNTNGDFSILDAGIDKAKEIISRTSSSASKKSKSASAENPKSKVGSTAQKSYSILGDLNLRPNNKVSLSDFFDQHNCKSFMEKNLLFVYYLEKILGLEERSLNAVYSCYKHLKERVPGNLYQSVADCSGKKGWLDTERMDRISVTVNGENILEHDLNKES